MTVPKDIDLLHVSGMVKTIPYKENPHLAPVGNGLDRSAESQPGLPYGMVRTIPYNGKGKTHRTPKITAAPQGEHSSAHC